MRSGRPGSGATEGGKLITCVLYRGGGQKVLQALHRKGLNAADWRPARGSAIGDPVSARGLPAEFEKEIVSVIVSAAQADEIFEYIFETAQIDRPHGGLLYMAALSKNTPMLLPDVPEEKR